MRAILPGPCLPPCFCELKIAHGILQFTMLITLRCAVLHVSCIVVRAPCEPFLWIAASAFLCKCITKDGVTARVVFVHGQKHLEAILFHVLRPKLPCCAVLCCPVLSCVGWGGVGKGKYVYMYEPLLKSLTVNRLVRYRGINNKGVLERPWTIWRVLDAPFPAKK